MDQHKLIILNSFIKNNQSFNNADHSNSIFIDLLPRKIMIPLKSNLATYNFHDTLVRNIYLQHPSFEIYLFDPRQQTIWMRKMFFCLHLRQSYEDHNGEIINIWNAYDNAPTPQDKYNIFIYSWLLHNGGVIMSPKLIPKISLFLITNKENIKRKALSVIFSDNGYFDNDLILSTPNAKLIKAILYFITQNVNKNQLSSPIHKKVHLLDDTLTGKFAVRKSFLHFIQNPSFEISNEGFRMETISCLSQNHKSKIVTENKTYYYNCKILNFITIDYPEFINNTISNDDIKNDDNNTISNNDIKNDDDNNVISNVDDKKDNNLDKNIIHQ